MPQLATRATTQYVGAYDLNRRQQIEVRRFQSRVVTADFNGAMGVGETLASVTWRTTQPWVCVMSDAALAARSTSVRVAFNGAGYAGLRANVTTTDGNTYLADFEVNVFSSEWDWFEDGYLATGPYTLTVSV